MQCPVGSFVIVRTTTERGVDEHCSYREWHFCEGDYHGELERYTQRKRNDFCLPDVDSVDQEFVVLRLGDRIDTVCHVMALESKLLIGSVWC